MAKLAKFLQGVAGAAGGAGLDIDEVFSTDVFKPNTSGNFSVTNNIDLDEEGGLVWLKQRDVSANHYLYDSNRGASAGRLATNLDNDEALAGVFFDSFNSDGFTVKDMNADEMVSWTFRKAPKFFDVVTYTGNGATHRDVPHNLGSAPGWVITKRLSATDNWQVYSKASANEYKLHWLNTTDATHVNYNPNNASYNWTDTVFYASSQYSFADTNENGVSYVSFLFANNDGDGEFGPDGDQDIIKCGSYTSSNPSNRPEIDLGFEPQWLLIKNTTASSNWMLVDNMRGLSVNLGDQTLAADSNAAENGVIGSPNAVALTPTGFKLTGGVTASNAGNGNTHIYMAIRRGSLAVPEDATEVFKVDQGHASNIPNFESGFPVDFALLRQTSADSFKASARLTGGKYLETSSTAAESSNSNYSFDYQDGWVGSAFGTSYYSWMWKRAPGFFDAVAYSGNSTSGRTVSHNLGVAPEMIWVKNRGNTNDWNVWHSALSATQSFRLNLTNAVENNSWFTALPTDQAFFTNSYQGINASGHNYIAYLFASAPGVSKVGSYTGTGNTLNVDCGFTSGARFVFIKTADDSGGGSWYTVDSARGIVAGDDPTLKLEETGAQFDNKDWIDPLSSGFTITSTAGTSFNASGVTYIFYAIA